MATLERQHGQDVWMIAANDGCTSAQFVPAFGGIGSSLTLPFRGVAREMLFQHDFFWNEAYTRTRGGWPFLFPVCGRMRRDGLDGVYLHEGRRYVLPSHGFSLRVPWQVTRSDEPDALEMELVSDEVTRDVYPFDFQVRLRYRVSPGVLDAEMEVRNTGSSPMPYFAGFHPYFRTPPAGQGKEEVRIALATPRQWLYNADQTDIIGPAPSPAFPASIQSAEVNETLNETPDGHATRMMYSDGFTLEVSFAEISAPRLFPFVQLYTIPERPFFCIEPWMGHPNAFNSLTGCRRLAPGGCDRAVLRVRAGSAATSDLRTGC
ncbi:MAG: aldose epimerase [Kiritimatiellae bacterium]|nr:aldose epimerase [Kiritimatiellia bacterium]